MLNYFIVAYHRNFRCNSKFTDFTIETLDIANHIKLILDLILHWFEYQVRGKRCKLHAYTAFTLSVAWEKQKEISFLTLWNVVCPNSNIIH